MNQRQDEPAPRWTSTKKISRPAKAVELAGRVKTELWKIPWARISEKSGTLPQKKSRDRSRNPPKKFGLFVARCQATRCGVGLRFRKPSPVLARQFATDRFPGSQHSPYDQWLSRESFPWQARPCHGVNRESTREESHRQRLMRRVHRVDVDRGAQIGAGERASAEHVALEKKPPHQGCRSGRVAIKKNTDLLGRDHGATAMQPRHS
mgnify:CR=1 FL=1